MRTTVHTWRSKDTSETSFGPFSISITWIPGIQLRASGLASSTYTHKAVSRTLTSLVNLTSQRPDLYLISSSGCKGQNTTCIRMRGWAWAWACACVRMRGWVWLLGCHLLVLLLLFCWVFLFFVFEWVSQPLAGLHLPKARLGGQWAHLCFLSFGVKAISSHIAFYMGSEVVLGSSCMWGSLQTELSPRLETEGYMKQSWCSWAFRSLESTADISMR